jgi:hypothetical protein
MGAGSSQVMEVGRQTMRHSLLRGQIPHKEATFVENPNWSSAKRLEQNLSGKKPCDQRLTLLSLNALGESDT